MSDDPNAAEVAALIETMLALGCTCAEVVVVVPTEGAEFYVRHADGCPLIASAGERPSPEMAAVLSRLVKTIERQANARLN